MEEKSNTTDGEGVYKCEDNRTSIHLNLSSLYIRTEREDLRHDASTVHADAEKRPGGTDSSSSHAQNANKAGANVNNALNAGSLLRSVPDHITLQTDGQTDGLLGYSRTRCQMRCRPSTTAALDSATEREFCKMSGTREDAALFKSSLK